MGSNKANVRCAIIGIGAMGRKYAMMLDRGEIEGLTLTSVCCRSDESADWAAENLNSSVRIFRGEKRNVRQHRSI